MKLASAMLMAALGALGASASAEPFHATADQILRGAAPPHRPAHCDTTVDMNICFAYDFHVADAALGRAYQAARKGADGEAQLQSAQRSWLAFRDQECNWEVAKFEGGSIQPGAFITCLTRVTKARTAELRAAVKE